MSYNESISSWKPVSFTHVEYLKGDFVGFILAWSSLLPFFILSGFVTHIYFRREIHTVFFFVGMFVNEFFNLALKYTVREPRPAGEHTVVNVEYGWPSSHSQFIWFFASYIICFVYIRSHSNNTLFDLAWKHSITVLTIISASIVAYSRYYLSYHSANQVVWGSAIGFILGVLWFGVVHIVVAPFFSEMVCWKACELLMIRDSSLIPNIMWFEYTTSRQEARARARKMSTNKVQ